MKTNRLLAAVLACAFLVAMSADCHAQTQGAAPQPAQARAGWDATAPMTVAVQAPDNGGVIQLKVFGWLEPYVDAGVQALIAGALVWFFKSRYSVGLDQAARDALTAWAKNTASSLIADGAVSLENKAIKVSSPHLAAEAASAATRIPDALKRFGINPVTAQKFLESKIVDAIPQTEAGAAMIAQASASPTPPVPVPLEAPPAGQADGQGAAEQPAKGAPVA